MRSILWVSLLAVVFLGAAAMETKAQRGENIVQVALAVNGPGSPFEGQFDTLIAAVLAADPVVLETLNGGGSSLYLLRQMALLRRWDSRPTTLGPLLDRRRLPRYCSIT